MAYSDYTCYLCSDITDSYLTVWETIIDDGNDEFEERSSSLRERTRFPSEFIKTHDEYDKGYLYIYDDGYDPYESGIKGPGRWEKRGYSREDEEFDPAIGHESFSGSIFISNTGNYVLVLCPACYKCFIKNTTSANGPHMVTIVSNHKLIPYEDFTLEVPEMSEWTYNSLLTEISRRLNPDLLETYIRSFTYWLGLSSNLVEMEYKSLMPPMNPLVKALHEKRLDFQPEKVDFFSVGLAGNMLTEPVNLLNQRFEPEHVELMLKLGYPLYSDLAERIKNTYPELAEKYLSDRLKAELKEKERHELLLQNIEDEEWLNAQPNSFFKSTDLYMAAYRGYEVLYKRLKNVFPKPHKKKSVRSIIPNKYDYKQNPYNISYDKRLELVLDYNGDPNSEFGGFKGGISVLNWVVQNLRSVTMAKILLKAGAKPESHLIGILDDPELNRLLKGL